MTHVNYLLIICHIFSFIYLNFVILIGLLAAVGCVFFFLGTQEGPNKWLADCLN